MKKFHWFRDMDRSVRGGEGKLLGRETLGGFVKGRKRPEQLRDGVRVRVRVAHLLSANR